MARLTAREREVLWLVAQGMTTIQIGRELEISPETVRTHLARIREKTGTTTKGAAVYHVYWRHIQRDRAGSADGPCDADGGGEASPSGSGMAAGGA